MDLMKLGTQLLMSKLGGNASEGGVMSALSGLLGSGGSNDSGGLDIGSLVSGMMSGQGGGDGLQGMVASWLGDGDNDAISGDQIKGLFGSDKIAEFAGKLGVDESTAADSLADAVPQMVDKSSSGGSLLDSLDLGDVMNIAKKLF